MPSTRTLLGILCLAALFTSCSKQGGDPWAGISDRMRKKAKRVYGARCENCHGKTGAGDGPEAHKCNPLPRSFHIKGWQNIVTNAEIERSIIGGGIAIGKSVIMPPNPDLRDRPKLVRAMRAYVRALANAKKTKTQKKTKTPKKSPR